jgi:hypothetical protein
MLYVMLVGAYPFERPEDKHDNQKLQKMIQVRPAGGPRGRGGSGCGLPTGQRERGGAVQGSPGSQESRALLGPQRILHVDYHMPSHVRVSDECKVRSPVRAARTWCCMLAPAPHKRGARGVARTRHPHTHCTTALSTRHAHAHV